MIIIIVTSYILFIKQQSSLSSAIRNVQFHIPRCFFCHSVTIEPNSNMNWNELSNVLSEILLFYWLIGYHLIFVMFWQVSLHLLSVMGQNPATPDSKIPAMFCPRTKFNPGQKIAWHCNVFWKETSRKPQDCTSIKPPSASYYQLCCHGTDC